MLRTNVPQCQIQMYNTSKLQSFLPNLEMVWFLQKIRTKRWSVCLGFYSPHLPLIHLGADKTTHRIRIYHPGANTFPVEILTLWFCRVKNMSSLTWSFNGVNGLTTCNEGVCTVWSNNVIILCLNFHMRLNIQNLWSLLLYSGAEKQQQKTA